MIVKSIYHGTRIVYRVYHASEIVFLCEPVTFHVIEDDNLIILGALSANSLPDGLYLDCAPDWVYPVQEGNVLTVEQVYKATQSGNVLEVE